MFFKVIEINWLIKCYRIIGGICIVFFFFQEVMYSIFEFRIPGIIPFLPLSIDVEDTDAYIKLVSEGFRSRSFFSEPAHFVQFLLPLMVIELFIKHKGHYIYASLIAATLLLLQSGNALLGMFIIGIGFLHYILFKTQNTTGKVILIFFVSIILPLTTYLYLNSEMGQGLLSRKEQISANDKSTVGDSGFVRIFRGYYVFDELNIGEKIIGVDNPDIIKQRIKSSKVAYSFTQNDTYFNTFQMFLIHTGIIGAVFFFLIVYTIGVKGNYLGRLCLVTFVALSFISSMFFTEMMALFLLFAYKSKSIEDKKLL